MLPTKGYFQDIECPFNNSICGRPYCHFRHKRKPNENVEDSAQETAKNVVPTYKPTPKSELANIHNNKSHIPISYVPDLAFKRERTARPITRIEKPTYKPTPLSILSSANKLDTSLPENHEHKETIKDIQENIASNVYDPLKSEINFEDLSSEFDLIDDIINDTDDPSSSINDNLIKLESDIEKEQNKLNLLQSELSTSDLGEQESENLPKITIKIEKTSPEDVADTEKSSKLDFNDKIIIKKEKLDDKSLDKEKKDKSVHKSSEKNDTKSDKEIKSSSKDKSKVSSDKHRSKDTSFSSKDRTDKELSKDKEKPSLITEKTSKSHKSSEREKHRKEEKKNSSKEGKESSKEKYKNKHKSRERSNKSPKQSKNDKKKSRHRKESGSNSESSSRHRRESGSNSESVSKDKKKSKHKTDTSSDSESTSSDTSVDRNQKTHRKEKKSSSKIKKQKSVEKSRDKNRIKEKNRKSREKSTSRSRSRSVSKSKESKPKHTSRHRTESKNRHKEKDKNRSRSREKEKGHKSRESDKEKDKTKSSSKDESKNRLKKCHGDKKEKREKSTSESNMSHIDDSDIFQAEDVSMVTEDLIPSDIDLDLEDEDETMRECYKIFNEYKPMPIQAAKVQEVEKKDLFEEDNNLYLGKKRTAHAGAEISSSYSKLPPPTKPKSVPLPGQTLANRYRIAQMAQGSNEQENIMNEVRNMTQQTIKRPATSLLEAARQHKIKKLQQQRLKEKERAKFSVNVVDNILNGIQIPSPSQVKVAPKKIAAVPNVALIEKAKERISLIKQNRMQSAKTVAQTQKGGRVAHVPEFNLSDIPDVLQADKSKLPVNVRTRFLTMIVEECSKLYALKQDAYTRALNEEFACYEKCKVLGTYRNSAMLAVNRLRKEIQDREVKGLGRLLSGESATTEKESDFKGKRFYEHVRKWILTEDELDVHGYPKESGERGKAIIINSKEVDYSMTDTNHRKCSRCSRVYQVDDDGWPLYEEECMYHPLKKRTIRGEQVFLCCKSSDDTGCATSDTHVFDGLKDHLLEGYQTTLPPESDDDPRSIAVYALDCEMCYTTKGLELTRVTIVDTDSKTVYESFVKPLNPIMDYNTRFSGITKDQMDRTSTSILQIQANILHLCNSETILVGHSLESDMKALKIVHGTVIDTSVLFPHKMGLPHKRALRALASEYLKKIIQNDVCGHDSAEDAITCMELIRWKLKEELKTRTKGH